MIKALRRKFVMTAMAATTILLVILLGTINVINIVFTVRNTAGTLNIIAEAEASPDYAGNSSGSFGSESPDVSLGNKKNDYDTLMSSNYFVVRYNKVFQVIYIDVERTSTISNSDAATLAKTVLKSGEQEGRIGKYLFKSSSTKDGYGTFVVFLDISKDINNSVNVLVVSLLVGFACFGLMLLLTVLLSNRAISPFAENIKKQKQFITNAGHEIKTPLAIIQTNTEAMELFNGENKWSKNIKAQTRRLSELTKSMLLLAKLDEDIKAERVDLNISEILSDTVSSFSANMESKNLSVDVNIIPDIILKANKLEMEQLSSILIDNAVKYSNEKGSIYIYLVKADKNIILNVANSCEELPKVPAEKLFDRFFRADEARTQENGGFGIGLSTAKTIVESYNGKISSEYKENNIISFTVKL